MLRINNDKAVLIAQQHIRSWRENAFSENDIRIQNALADEDGTARLQAVLYREYLRNLPQLCIGKDVDALKAILDGVKTYSEFILVEAADE